MHKLEVSGVETTPVGRVVPDRIGKFFSLPNLYMAGFILLIAFLTAYPVWSIFFHSFQINAPGQPAAYGLASWTRVFSEPAILQTIGNSFMLAAGIVLTATPLFARYIYLTFSKTRDYPASAQRIALIFTLQNSNFDLSFPLIKSSELPGKRRIFG
jgi:ABC-type sugar transport system permease subunit